MKTTRRSWLGGAAAGGLTLILPRTTGATTHQVPQPAPPPQTPQAKAPAIQKPTSRPLALEDFQPKSMLHVAEHRPQKA
ncbi:MAG: hypothetical protein ACRDFT_08925, partial [bacterium]